ncbi:MerR family transcriptional regulator [Blastococcus sp. VKM Ac-2987]|uniref:MerR family transcriptional regulator n=1 Tax=Blastococcus sp. VKM Ac-2987 TaxID=3004141 RepID=UPI0022AB9FFE|nr:MerR family transcriptional regulator [Blastococcus sp. VKM Ac-2987]MCZ2860265.1 MerR family transcriptional regulator [Blastococcus sp. VKM Ac-2987]
METSADDRRGTGSAGRKWGLRTVDVARRAGYSVQQIRDLEQAGVLPPADRTPAGYRRYTERHVHAALAYRAFAAGIGPVEAKRVLRAALRGGPAVLVLLDAAHARLHAERRELALAREAAGAIAAEPIAAPRASDAMSITELAAALGIRPSTLRHWDAEGLVPAHRSGPRSTRTYSPDAVRDARITHQLRRAGYRIGPLRALLDQLRRTGRGSDVEAGLAARSTSIDDRSRALLQGAAALDRLLDGGP